MKENEKPLSRSQIAWEEEKKWWRLKAESRGQSSRLVENPEDSEDDTIEVTFLKDSEKNSPRPGSQDQSSTE